MTGKQFDLYLKEAVNDGVLVVSNYRDKFEHESDIDRFKAQ